MGHRTAPHTPGYQKCIHRGSVQPGGSGGRDWSVLLFTLCLGPYSHPSTNIPQWSRSLGSCSASRCAQRCPQLQRGAEREKPKRDGQGVRMPIQVPGDGVTLSTEVLRC